MSPSGDESVSYVSIHYHKSSNESYQDYQGAARKAYGFWNHSNLQGKSDYLERKEVVFYGIRFRSIVEFGNVAVVPMFDEYGKLWSYQLLNPDGTKRFAKDARICDLFHSLRPIKNENVIGTAESYVTAATCMENTGITCVCCFGCNNMKGVISVLLSKYKDKRFAIFADNDRHLEKNEGILKAQEARKLDDGRGCLGCS